MTTWTERAERLCTNWQTVQIGRTTLDWGVPLGWFFRVKDCNGAILAEGNAASLDRAAELAEDNPQSRLAALRDPTP